LHEDNVLRYQRWRWRAKHETVSVPILEGAFMFNLIVRSCLLASLVAVASASAASAAPLKTNCGAPIQSSAITQSEPVDFTNTSFKRVTGAVTNVIVPGGATRCVKVRFTVLAACAGDVGSEDVECFIRALANNVELEPALGGSQLLAARETTSVYPELKSFHWVRRLEPGTHTVQVQVRRNNEGTAARLHYWTMDTEILR
jgi:hypothetical protein